MWGGWCRKGFGTELDAIRLECSSKGAVAMAGPSLGVLLWMGMSDLQWGEAAAEPQQGLHPGPVALRGW